MVTSFRLDSMHFTVRSPFSPRLASFHSDHMHIAAPSLLSPHLVLSCSVAHCSTFHPHTGFCNLILTRAHTSSPYHIQYQPPKHNVYEFFFSNNLYPRSESYVLLSPQDPSPHLPPNPLRHQQSQLHLPTHKQHPNLPRLRHRRSR